jgi:hypothetical protein
VPKNVRFVHGRRAHGRVDRRLSVARDAGAGEAPVVERYDANLVEAKGRVDAAASESEAAEALVDYVETYASRLEAQESALRAIEGPLVRMRADARELVTTAEAMGGEREKPGDRRSFFAEHFQGVAGATAELGERLQRPTEAATVGEVLHASWASHAGLDLPLEELGPESALGFARQVEGLYARYHARSNQLRAERSAVRRLLDLLIERQLSRRLDSLFSGEGMGGLGSLLAHDGRSQDWQDLGRVVSRTLGLPSGGGGGTRSEHAALGRLDYFARGAHRD